MNNNVKYATITVLSSLMGIACVTGAMAITRTHLPPAQAQPAERKLEIRKSEMPAGVIEIVKVNNLQSPAFPSDAEIEVKNISDKPIYFMYVALVFPETRRFSARNVATGTFFYYGDPRLADLRESPTSTDMPLLPSKTAVLYLPESNRRGLGKKIEQDPNFAGIGRSRVTLILQKISFGDGTGYINETPDKVSSKAKSRQQSKHGQSGFAVIPAS